MRVTPFDELLFFAATVSVALESEAHSAYTACLCNEIRAMSFRYPVVQ